MNLWTPEQDDTVHKLWKAGVADEQIGRALCRTAEAVKARRRERRWVADRSYARDAQTTEHYAASDEMAFRANTTESTRALILRITAGITAGTLRTPGRA